MLQERTKGNDEINVYIKLEELIKDRLRILNFMQKN